MRLFLTGDPGVGKTTVIRGIAERLEGIACAGFIPRKRGKPDGEPVFES